MLLEAIHDKSYHGGTQRQCTCNDIRIFNSNLFAIDDHPFPKRILFCLHTYFSLDIVNIHTMKDSG